MNSFNDLKGSKGENKKTNKAQVELQRRSLTELSQSQPLHTRPQRTGKPLSKFTISSNPPPSSSPHGDSARPIPAYRTCAQESLPILSPDDLKRMNISRYTGMSLYDYHSPPPPTLSNSANTLRTKQRSRLQRKTIHRSLEDLGNIRNHSLDYDSISPSAAASSRKSDPPLDSSDMPSRQMEKERLARNRKMPVGAGPDVNSNPKSVVPPTPESPKHDHNPRQSIASTTEAHFHKDRDNAISTNPSSTDENITSDDENWGERRPTSGIATPNKELPLNVNGQREFKIDEEENEHLHNLSLENDSLKKQVAFEKREYIMFRVATELISRSLKSKSLQLIEMEETIQQRREECAARVVLHHLLLNSWRTTKAQVGAIKLENTQMHKTIDNQALQLNIIRKMQSMEKEKTSSILKDYAEVKRKYCQVMKENEAIKLEYAKVLEEKSALERHLRNLSDENVKLSTDLRIRVDIREMQLKSLQLDRLQTEKFTKENEQLAKESELAKNQIKELVNQRVQWQEKAMYLESKCFELKVEVEGKDKVYEKVLTEKQEISKENEILSLSKSNLEKAVEESQAKLIETTAQRNKWESSYKQCRAEVEDLEDQKEYLKTALHQYMKENKEMREKLKSCTKNAQRRRVWGAALYYFLFPFETFKRFYYGTPERYRQPPHHRQVIQQAQPRLEGERMDVDSSSSSRHSPDRANGFGSRA